jgi:2-oxoglutarate dehydrogenase E1 component
LTLIVNKQVCFTTNPIHSRSTPYCSDLGKAFNCPNFHCKETDWLSSRWTGLEPQQLRLRRVRPTGYDIDLLRRIQAAGTVPEGFKLHRQMEKIFQACRGMAEQGEGIDWGIVEAMAFCSLFIEGNHVRITGQDVQHGTFSHRHAVVTDQNINGEFTPLNSLATQMNPSAPMEDLSRPDV